MVPNVMSCQERHAKCWSFSGAEKRGADKSPESCGGHPDGSPQQFLSFQAPSGKMPGANCGELLGGHEGRAGASKPPEHRALHQTPAGLAQGVCLQEVVRKSGQCLAWLKSLVLSWYVWSQGRQQGFYTGLHS